MKVERVMRHSVRACRPHDSLIISAEDKGPLSMWYGARKTKQKSFGMVVYFDASARPFPPLDRHHL
jgi:hypothetical protein